MAATKQCGRGLRGRSPPGAGLGGSLRGGKRGKVTFGELTEICRFFAIRIAAEKYREPIVLMEAHRHVLRPLEGASPEGTSLNKQACGASGLERSLNVSRKFA
jgi:hypothetical protein